MILKSANTRGNRRRIEIQSYTYGDAGHHVGYRVAAFEHGVKCWASTGHSTLESAEDKFKRYMITARVIDGINYIE